MSRRHVTADEPTLRQLLTAIAVGDDATADHLLRTSPELARAAVKEGATRTTAEDHYLNGLGCYIYAGDTALHIVAAAHRTDLARQLIGLGADIGARNRRGAAPLHAATVGAPGSQTWNPEAQSATIALLIEAGADPNARDMGGATPLHRAVRNRCAAAVRTLLDAGADATIKNENGSTPTLLALRQTGRGGSGSPEAKAQQALIIEFLRRHDAA